MASHVALSKANQVWKPPAWSCLGDYVAEAVFKFLTVLPLPPRMHVVPQGSDEAYKYAAMETRMRTSERTRGHDLHPGISVALHLPASLVL